MHPLPQPSSILGLAQVFPKFRYFVPPAIAPKFPSETLCASEMKYHDQELNESSMKLFGPSCSDLAPIRNPFIYVLSATGLHEIAPAPSAAP